MSAGDTLQTEIIQPINEDHWRRERAMDLTSTEVAALFGCSPHCTEFELHHRKRNQEVVQLEPNERVKWGTRLQDSIAAGIAEDSGFKIRKMTEYIRAPVHRLGASFDFEIVPSGLLEVKNVDALQFRDGWIVEGDDVEAPPHIEIQIQVQLLLSKKKFGLIGSLIGGNRIVALHRNPDDRMHQAILERAADFWDAVRRGEAPLPDYRRDSWLLAHLHGNVEPGKIYDARGDSDFVEIAAEYRRLGEEIKDADEARAALKMRILERIGDAEKAVFDGGTVSCGRIAETRVEAFDRAAYRGFRVNWKKGTK
jgi:predicted phage-related endonuclease